MHPVLFHIGSFTLYTYGLFVALGLMSAVWVSRYLARPYAISSETITDLFFVILLSALFGARLLYVLINIDAYRHNLMDVFKIWEGGLVFFGGFCGAVVATAVYIRKKQLSLWLTADILAPGIALGHAIGRIGCLFAGCCYGKPSDLPFAIQFTHPDTLAPAGIYLHPTQIYMVLSNLLLFAILLWIQRKKKFHGMVFLCYILIYSIFRSVIEFFRGDFRGDFIFDFLSMSQGIGILAAVVAVAFLIRLARQSHGIS